MYPNIPLSCVLLNAQTPTNALPFINNKKLRRSTAVLHIDRRAFFMLEYADKLGILSFYCFMQRCECPQNSEALFRPLAVLVAVSSAAPCCPASSSALRANIARCFTRSALRGLR